MTKRLAIVPARGGSKRIPRKNIKDFCGKPIISYVVNSALKSKLFNKIHISSDSDEIRKYSEKLGCKTDFKRPNYLSGDKTTIMEVLKYVVSKYKEAGNNYDEIWLLMACSPLLDASDLIEASHVFKKSTENKKLLAVCEYPAPIEWAFNKDENHNLYPVQPGKFAVRSQDLTKTYYDSGTFAIFKENHILLSSNDGDDKGFIGFLLDKTSAIDIDTQKDWDLAELLFKTKNKLY